MNNVTLIQFLYGQTVPLSAAYLATGLERENIRFDLKLFNVHEFYRAGRNLETLRLFLENSKDILAIGCFSDMLPFVLVAVKKIKEKSPKKIIILGGVGPTMVAEEIIGTFNFIDFIIKGCGVFSLPTLIKKIRNKKIGFDNISGLVFRDKLAVAANDSTDSFLETTKLPAYHCIKNVEIYEQFLIKTSSGCPYNCTFCYALPATGKKVAYRDINGAIEEIRLIKKIKKDKEFILRIIDEAFVVNSERVIEFCNLLRKNGFNISWVCYGRVDCMDKELLESMSTSGCKEIYYGIESGSDRILEKIKKGFTIDDAIKIALLSKKYMHVTASFIYRYPFETLSEFKDTLSILRYLQFKDINIQLHPLAPVKNSEMYLIYSDRLNFSKKEPCDYIHGSIESLPQETSELIKNHPRVFYDYCYYDSEELSEINKLLAENRKFFYSSNTFWKA